MFRIFWDNMRFFEVRVCINVLLVWMMVGFWRSVGVVVWVGFVGGVLLL